MKIRLSACAALIVSATVAVSAQWPSFRAPDVPRLANGTVNLAAPPPRNADNRPDFSGVWINPPRELNLRFGGIFDVSEFLGAPPPLQPWAADLKKQRMAANMTGHPEVHCLPIGTLLFNAHPLPRKMVQTRNLLVILYETHQGSRQIFLDGRPAPGNDPQPWWHGYSRGTWEGDTLVVETTNYRDSGWLDVNGTPLTDAARTIERIRRPSYGQLLIDITIDDPKAYTAPFTISLVQQLAPDTELIEMICQENNRTLQHLAK
jgi:hypothetical protein